MFEKKNQSYLLLYVHIYDLSFVITKGHLSFYSDNTKKVTSVTEDNDNK